MNPRPMGNSGSAWKRLPGPHWDADMTTGGAALTRSELTVRCGALRQAVRRANPADAHLLGVTMNAKEALRWMENDTGIMSCNDDAWPIVIRALRLLAAAEANDGSIPEMTKAVQEGRGIELGCQFERERNGLAARVGELEKDIHRRDLQLVEAVYGQPCPTPDQWSRMQEVASKALSARSKP